jgi:hypothetical protein
MTPDVTPETLRNERDKYKRETNDLKEILESLINGLEFFITIFRIILYLGSVGVAWFYLKDKALAIGIVSSLTAAHVLIQFKSWLRRKKDKLTKRDW